MLLTSVKNPFREMQLNFFYFINKIATNKICCENLRYTKTGVLCSFMKPKFMRTTISVCQERERVRELKIKIIQIYWMGGWRRKIIYCV